MGQFWLAPRFTLGVEMRDSIDNDGFEKYCIAEMDFRFLTLLCNILMVLLL